MKNEDEDDQTFVAAAVADEDENEELEVSPEALAIAVDALAEAFHEEWRKTRLNSEGEYTPRIKTTTDESWIAENKTNQVDIANTNYPDLPADWQAENKSAAKIIVEIINENDDDLDLSDSETRLSAGERIHAAWLSRNEWAKGTELEAPFSQLSEEEQAKDIEQLIIAQRVFAN